MSKGGRVKAQRGGVYRRGGVEFDPEKHQVRGPGPRGGREPEPMKPVVEKKPIQPID